MKYLKTGFLLASLSIVYLFSSCDKEEQPDPIIPNEEELITSLYYVLIEDGTNDTTIFSFVDLDGDGGDDPVIITDTLMGNSSYTGYVVLLNELEDPAENITEEVMEEAEEHQFFYTEDPEGHIMVSYEETDVDFDGNPIGIHTILTTNEDASGSLTIVLRHEPDKNAAGVSDGNIENAGGETDIEVVFDIVVQN